MSLRFWMTITAVVFAIAGLLLALLPVNLLLLFGFPAPPPPFIPENPAALTAWNAVAFARMCGVLLFALGVLLWMIRAGIQLRARRAAAAGLFIGIATAAAFSFIQQVTIWRTAAGWVLFAVFLVLAVGYGYWALFPRVIVPEPDDVLELERASLEHHEAPAGPNEREGEERG